MKQKVMWLGRHVGNMLIIVPCFVEKREILKGHKHFSELMEHVKQNKKENGS